MLGGSSSGCSRRQRHWPSGGDRATVYALGLAVIASVYVGFAVADGRPKVIASKAA